MSASESGGPISIDQTVSLRSNVAWTFAGNAFYAASQWLILSLIAKLGNSQMLGEYALAVAITAPVVMLSHLNLRAVLVTDVHQVHPSGDYLAVRFWTTGAGLLIVAAIALLSPYPGTVAAVIILVGVAQGSEATSDIFFGMLQRRERMDKIASSMTARGILSVAALGIVLWLTHDLVWAVTALVLGGSRSSSSTIAERARPEKT